MQRGDCLCRRSFTIHLCRFEVLGDLEEGGGAKRRRFAARG